MSKVKKLVSESFPLDQDQPLCFTGAWGEGDTTVRVGILEQQGSRPHKRIDSADRARYCCCLCEPERSWLNLLQRFRQVQTQHRMQHMCRRGFICASCADLSQHNARPSDNLTSGRRSDGIGLVWSEALGSVPQRMLHLFAYVFGFQYTIGMYQMY